jgi:hypothetical protein
MDARDGRPTPVRPRPRWLQAMLGGQVPDRVEIDSEAFRLRELYKHDSWAATGLYEGATTGRLAVCKFHRRQVIAGFWVSWTGLWMARHEARLLDALADVPGVPRRCGPVTVNGRVDAYAVARWFLAGHPLRKKEAVNDAFFPRLEALLNEMHRRRIAYVDLHKRENIIVGEDGAPYLVDFQIGVMLSDRWPFRSILRMLQQSDRYHFHKHWGKCRPDQCAPEMVDIRKRPPWWIGLHRRVARPFRELRRRLLVRLGVRAGRGRVETEAMPEAAVRDEAASRHAA